MCCFSRAVDLVADTNIFARAGKDNRQFLVYSMILSAKEDLAMILPVPTPKASKEDAVKFINLEKYHDFFADMRKGFPPPKGDGRGGNTLGKEPGSKLKVVDVGSYEASFVPTVKDFKRLDERFKLPEKVWDGLPQYKDYGFVVFKLKKGDSKVHPMAFDFPRADGKSLFFPTVHIHDGKVHDKADFDHLLFCQSGGGEDLTMNWEESPQLAESFMKIDQTQGIVTKSGHVYKRRLKGKLKNEDILV